MEPDPTPAAGPRSSELREERPAAESWRADSLARSQHSRLDREIRPPAEDFDEQRAELLCAQITRERLGDFAPALLLLPAVERRRAQALLAYTHTLFDFARQHGVEGERLAQINRWEFTLELALSGQTVGQPIFVCMARENERRAWPVDALDELASCARLRAARPQPGTIAEAEAGARHLARAIGTALLEDRLSSEANDLAGAIIRIYMLQHLGEEVRRKRCPIPSSELDEASGSIDEKREPAALIAAVRHECARLRSRLLRAPRGLVELPDGYRRAAVYSLLAALRLLTDIETCDAELLVSPPRLGLVSRLGFLFRARWLPGG